MSTYKFTQHCPDHTTLVGEVKEFRGETSSSLKTVFNTMSEIRKDLKEMKVALNGKLNGVADKEDTLRLNVSELQQKMAILEKFSAAIEKKTGSLWDWKVKTVAWIGGSIWAISGLATAAYLLYKLLVG